MMSISFDLVDLRFATFISPIEGAGKRVFEIAFFDVGVHY